MVSGIEINCKITCLTLARPFVYVLELWLYMTNIISSMRVKIGADSMLKVAKCGAVISLQSWANFTALQPICTLKLLEK